MMNFNNLIHFSCPFTTIKSDLRRDLVTDVGTSGTAGTVPMCIWSPVEKL